MGDFSNIVLSRVYLYGNHNAAVAIIIVATFVFTNPLTDLWNSLLVCMQIDRSNDSNGIPFAFALLNRVEKEITAEANNYSFVAIQLQECVYVRCAVQCEKKKWMNEWIRKKCDRRTIKEPKTETSEKWKEENKVT